MWRGNITPRKAAVLLEQLPRGSNTWKFIGGPAAITEVTEAVWSLEHTETLIAWNKGGRKGKKPQPRPYPKGVNEDYRKQQEFEKKAEQFRRKFLRADDIA